MQRAKYLATAVCVLLSVLSVFFWYRSTTTASDAIMVGVSPARTFIITTTDGVLYSYLQTRTPPATAAEWADASIFNADSQYRIGDSVWRVPQYRMVPPGVGVGRDPWRTLGVQGWDTGARFSLLLVTAVFAIPPIVRGYRAVRRRLHRTSASATTT